MALPDGLIIDVGTGPNTQTGDPLRTAYQKSNAADEYLDQNKANTSDVTPNGGNTTDTAASLREGIDGNKTAIENFEGVADAVKYTEQTLTPQQKQQAQTNIGVDEFQNPLTAYQNALNS